ncbi:hypothetical protein Verru16b_01822 [Lacunisphaera limnophila]|uniref:DUF218 domain-containing protein n=1 Tax=Lacunisphaera limnophila TaxID=1838286 RepID=A0A1D8AV27_9BACT|nr:YdcF family protein [Lacunisphaera limnophila]AOS44754.1 hypothetical protein Verru16b_01822 [Lacunisphaera limnophila]
MLILNKVLPLLVLPFGLVCGLVLLALWRKKWWPGIVALGVLYVCSLPVVAGFLIGRLESRYPRLEPAAAGPADAVVVLGGVLGYLPPDEQLGSWLVRYERFDAGLALLEAGRVPQVVFTGALMPWDHRTVSEGEELRRLARFRGVAADRIVVTRRIANTADEARAVAELVRERGWRRVILVTTGWHMPRSVLLFRRAGVDCLPFPVEVRFNPGRPLLITDFLPSAAAWKETETALRECYGYLFYRLFR